jgi:hypothetical protein
MENIQGKSDQATASEKNIVVRTNNRRHNLLLATCFYSMVLISINTLLWIVSWNTVYNCL